MQSYKSVIDTFRAAPQSANASVYDNMFGNPVQHRLDVGKTLMHTDRYVEEKKSNSPPSRRPPRSKRGYGTLVQKVELRRRMYRGGKGVPGKAVRDYSVAAILGSSTGGLFTAFRLPSHTGLRTGGKLVVKRTLHPRMQQLIARSVGSQMSEQDDRTDTTVFEGGLIPYNDNISQEGLTLLKTHKGKSANSDQNYCDVTGLCVGDDDYVRFDGSTVHRPVLCGDPSDKHQKNRALQDIVASLRDGGNPTADGAVLDASTFRLYNISNREIEELNLVGHVEPPSSDTLNNYVLWGRHADLVEPVIDADPLSPMIHQALQWHRNRAKVLLVSGLVILVALVLLFVGIGIHLASDSKTTTAQALTQPQPPPPPPPVIAPETAPVPPQLKGGGGTRIPHTLSVMVENLRERVANL